MRIFLSQVMRGRSEEEILKERLDFTEKLLKKYPNATIVDSYDSSEGFNAVYKLGVAITKLAEADAICFLPRSLTEGRGCLVEYAIARLYGIEIVDTY